MKFDKNTAIGFGVLALLFFGYFYFTNQEQYAQQKKQATEQAIKDSIDKASRPRVDSLALTKEENRKDSLNKITTSGHFNTAANGTEELAFVENDVFKVAFTNKGGQPKWVELKKFKNQDSGLVKLAGTDFDKISYLIKTDNNNTAQTADLFFQPGVIAKNADGSSSISFSLASADSGSAVGLTHTFVIKKDDYLIDFSVNAKGADQLFTQGIMNFVWQYNAKTQEASLSYEKENTQVGYVHDGEFDYHTISKTNEASFDKSVNWVGVRQRFFFSILIAKEKFSSGKMEWTIPEDTTNSVVESVSQLKVPVPAGSNSVVSFGLYYGPSDYHILKKYDMKLEELVNLGQGIYAFVRPLNRYVIMPIFDFLKGFVGNYGIVIVLLTLFIRLVISPLTYSSYLSGAKMKALRPEIAKLKEKNGADQQQMSMDQMKLFREAGVNPLGGCIPALLQIPIFFALFSFFNSEVGLRGAEFLWSQDLSAPDQVITFGNIPVISFLFGNHISLFNITAVLTSLLISIYSMSMTPDQSNPVMKYMPYIFPVFLLFFFNRLPSGLTWYYTVSNLITLALQFVIQNYIIDHNKILLKIDANRKKPKTKSKWQERMEKMQDQQKRLKDMQEKTKKK